MDTPTKTHKRSRKYRDIILTDMDDAKYRTTRQCHQLLGTPDEAQASTILGKAKMYLASHAEHDRRLLKEQNPDGPGLVWAVVPRNYNPSLN